jgi:hypothetical protein
MPRWMRSMSALLVTAIRQSRRGEHGRRIEVESVFGFSRICIIPIPLLNVCSMMPDSTTRLLQILRTTLALVKYYEGHPASAATLQELKESMQRAIDDLAAIEAAENTPEASKLPAGIANQRTGPRAAPLDFSRIGHCCGAPALPTLRDEKSVLWSSAWAKLSI